MGITTQDDKGSGPGLSINPSFLAPECRRAYYRVSATLPIRWTALASDEVEAAIFDLTLPDPLVAPVFGEDGDADSPLMAQLRRIEEKLDLLLGASAVPVPRGLGGKDRQPVVFSGSGLSVDVAEHFAAGDAYRVEILLPPPYSRVVRAVARAVRDAEGPPLGSGLRAMPLALVHMEDDERDALVAYSYDVQRAELRTRQGSTPEYAKE